LIEHYGAEYFAVIRDVSGAARTIQTLGYQGIEGGLFVLSVSSGGYFMIMKMNSMFQMKANERRIKVLHKNIKKVQDEY